MSQVAIERARSEQALASVHYERMNCEEMDFDNDSFDLACGTGILHHLDTGKAYREIARVLAPGGRAVFVEPFGHNPVINLYRRLTPAMRSADEHHLRRCDLEVAEQSFDRTSVSFFDLFTLATVPFRRFGFFPRALRLAERADQAVFRLGSMRWYAWTAVLDLREARAVGGPLPSE